MSSSARKAVLQERLEKVQAAINGTLDRNAASYSADVQSLTSLPLSRLQQMERSILNELARLERGGRFAGIGFKRICD